MTSPLFPLAVWQEGSVKNAIPANDNTVHIQAGFGPALGFSDAEPGSPTTYDQYVIRTAWGGFGVGNIVIYVDGAWREFTSFDGLSKIIGGIRYVRAASVWKQMVEWVDIPPTASSPGVPGQLARDVADLFFYVCTAADTWKRAALTSSVTPPPPPAPTYPTPTLLLDYEDATVIDKSPNAMAITTVACTVTTSFKKFGSQGLNINGGSLEVNDPLLVVGTQDFTMDMWVYPTNISSERFFIDSRDGSGSGRGFGWIYRSGGYCGLGDNVGYIGSDSSGQSGIQLVQNQWSHVEVGRKTGTIYLFVNGNLVAQSAAGAFPNNFVSQHYYIHAGQYYPVGVESMEGYADEVRIVIGQCVHTVDFVPPTAAYPTY